MATPTIVRTGARMARGLTPTQRRHYQGLRELTAHTLARYPRFAQRSLADAADVTQSVVSRVLKGSLVSVVTLERIARAMIPSLSTEDAGHLRRALAETLAAIHDGKPR